MTAQHAVPRSGAEYWVQWEISKESPEDGPILSPTFAEG